MTMNFAIFPIRCNSFSFQYTSFSISFAFVWISISHNWTIRNLWLRVLWVCIIILFIFLHQPVILNPSASRSLLLPGTPFHLLTYSLCTLLETLSLSFQLSFPPICIISTCYFGIDLFFNNVVSWFVVLLMLLDCNEITKFLLIDASK